MQVHLNWVADADRHREFLAGQDFLGRDDIALVSPDMPLRANLSVLDNIALIPQYRGNLAYAKAADQAWALLVATGYQDCHAKRDPDLDHTERCVAKLLRAVISHPAIILIDRPAMLLPDTYYPPFLFSLLDRLAAEPGECRIVDYQWNQALYPVEYTSEYTSATMTHQP